MKKLFLLIAFVCLAGSAQAQSSLATLANSMQPGTWAEFTSAETSITQDMIYPGPPSDGGIDYILNGVWDSVHRDGYFWSGVHADQGGAPECYHAVAWNELICADKSQRFIKYTDASNTFSTPLDAVTGKPHNSWAGEVGGHPYEDLAIDAATGDVYKLNGLGISVSKWTYATNTWSLVASPNAIANDSIMPLAGFPEANGLILVDGFATNGQVYYLPYSGGAWTSVVSGLSIGDYEPVAVYNPVLHNMLIGGGGGASLSRARTFYVLSYTAGVWSVSAARQIPDATLCGNPYATFIFDSAGQNSLVSVDPVSGKYIVLSKDTACNPVTWSYDSVLDTWTQLTGSNVQPPNLLNGYTGGAGGSRAAVVPIPEYGVLMYLSQTGTNSGPYARVFLYKPGNSTPPVIGPPAVITTISGTPQSATVGAPFTNALQAKVVDASSNAVPNASVTFTAPSSGASASFGGNVSVSTMTNSGGIATSSTALANATAGSYVVAASVNALSTSFSLTNLPAGTGTTLFSPSDMPGPFTTTSPAVELGIKFYSDVAGAIAGIRFYKVSGDTGSHTGALWTSAGQLLATGTFANETASGWQQLTFPAAIAITANTTYVASYHSTAFYYSYNFFISAGVDSPPLHAPVNGSAAGLNGVYAYGTTTTFPNQSYIASNYWVDVAFTQSMAGAVTPTPVDLPKPAAVAYSFAEKCQMIGNVQCQGFDDVSDLRYGWESGAQNPAVGDICDKSLAGKVNYVSWDPMLAQHANTIAYVQNGQCVYPSIDTTVKRSGTGSLKFRTPTHSGPSVGEYYGVFKKYDDGHFGYIGPMRDGKNPGTNQTATHLGDELWVQWYQYNDASMLNTTFAAAHWFGYAQTASAGSTTVTIAACPTGWVPAPADSIGRHIRFYNENTGFVNDALYVITGLANGGCSIVVDHSPTPNGPGGVYPGYAQAFIEGSLVNNQDIQQGWKTFGVFPDPAPGVGTCCLTAAQIAVNNLQMGVPTMYSYGQGTATYFTPDAQKGCVFNSYPDAVGVRYPEPPCTRYHAGTGVDQGQLFTVRINTGAGTIKYGSCPTTANGIFQMWINDKLVQDHNDFVLCWGQIAGAGDTNGFGQYNLSPYMTNKDPNQDHPEGAIWIDDLVISAQPIPLLSKVGSTTPLPPQDPCVTDPLRITGVKWPSSQTGSRSITYNSGAKKVASVLFVWPGTLTVTDTRNCKAIVNK